MDNSQDRHGSPEASIDDARASEQGDRDPSSPNEALGLHNDDRPHAENEQREPVEAHQIEEEQENQSHDTRSSSDNTTTATPDGNVMIGNHTIPATTRSKHSKLWGVLEWLWEILACLVAILLLIAQFVILHYFHARFTSTWTAPMSLNTLVATISTISRVNLAFVASEVVFQALWSRLSASVALSEAEALNQASRGAWASLKLLVLSKRSWRRPDLILALVVVLVSLTMGAFAQQAVQVKDCHFIDPDAKAFLPNIRTIGDLAGSLAFKTGEPTEPWRPESAGLTPASRAAVMLSLLDPYGNHSTIFPTCSTGNCTFRAIRDADDLEFTHRSIGFCSQCLDISSLINTSSWQVNATRHEAIRHWTLPKTGISVSATAEYDNNTEKQDIGILSGLTSLNIGPYDEDMALRLPSWLPGQPGTADFIDVSRNSFINADLISIDDYNFQQGVSVLNTEHLAASAATCTLYPCLKTYFASVEGGHLHENLVSSERLMDLSSPCWVESWGNLGSRVTCTTFYATDSTSTRTPCLLGEHSFTAGNLSSAPGVVTLLRWNDSTAEPVNITSPPECLYGVSLPGFVKVVRFLLKVALAGKCRSSNWNYLLYICDIKGLELPDNNWWDRMPAFWIEGFLRLPKRSSADLGAYLDAVAESLTRYLRKGTFQDPSRNYSYNEWRQDATKEYVKGDAWRTTTCFDINLSWLALPAVVTVLTSILLIWTICRCSMNGEVVWKTSILPFLYYHNRMDLVRQGEGAAGFPPPEEEPLMRVGELEKDARMVSMRLSRNGVSVLS